ncbi:MAG: SIMPL domain-containing protein [Oligoflexia bacterium]|nr:SIMPL domain-containing protein [Oligoflexia bacterium]
MKTIFYFLLMLIPINAISQEDRTVSVRGEGVLKIKPDIAYLNLDLMTRAKDAKSAQSQNAQEMDRLMKKLKNQFKIDSKDIQTVNFSLQPNYRYDKNGKQIFQNFQVNHSLTIKIKKIDTLGSILDQISIGGDEDKSLQISNITFDTDKRTEYELNALESAMKNALNRAEALAKFSNTKIAGVRRISDSTINYQPYRAQNVRSFGKMEMLDAAASTEIQAGEITVNTNVAVEYDLK